MSELINTKSGRNDLHWKLLTSVSALALIGNFFVTLDAKADDAGQPTVWIELGGQLEQYASTQEPFSPPFLLKMPRPSFETVHPLDAEKPPRFAIGGDAKVTFEPAGTDWVFSAAIRYGRSNSNKSVQQMTLYPSPTLVPSFPDTFVPYLDNYATTAVRHDESHMVVDFQAGRDFGLGMFGRNGTSTLSLGVRDAQFESKTTVDIRERPDLHIHRFNGIYPFKYYHAYHLTGHSTRSFNAIGPSLSWDASAPFAGKPESTEFTLDWGVRAAVLFGRQKAAVSHQTTGHYYSEFGKYKHHSILPYANAPAPRNSARSITIPNFGGFVGISVKRSIAKVSLGYRADFFFGAVDGGIDTRVSKTLGLNGPYASISVGL